MIRTALFTGGNRGIGLEVCKQLAARGFRILLTARDSRRGQAAAAGLASRGLDVRFFQLDVSSDKSLADCSRRLAAAETMVDVSINNAGVNLSENRPENSR